MISFRYTLLDDGTYSVKVYGERGTASSEVVIPEIRGGAPVTKITFGKLTDGNFQRLYIPASVVSVDFSGNRYGIFAAQVDVDDKNPYFSSDGKALYSRDGKILYRFFPRYTEKYEVKKGTEILGKRAFMNHRFLNQVILPEGLREIGSNCFDQCTGITELMIPDSVAKFGSSPFSYMELKTLRLPKGLRYLDNHLFPTLKLQELYIPASVESISEKIIVNLSEDDKCRIPEAETFIGKYTVSSENPFFRSVNGVIYSKDMTVLVKAPNSVPSSFEVPKSVVRIADRAFLYCRELSEVILPEGLEYIGERAFFGCPLVDISLPKSVIDVGAKAINASRKTIAYDTLKADLENFYPLVSGDPFEQEVIIKNAETGEIKSKMWAYPDFKYIRNCFDEQWNFNYDLADRDIGYNEYSIPVISVCYIAYRLSDPFKMSPETKQEFEDMRKEVGVKIMTYCIVNDDFEMFVKFARFYLTEENITEVIDSSAEHNAVEYTAFLLDFRNKHFGGVLGDLNLD